MSKATNKNINYQSALKSLFEGLKFADEKIKTDEPYKYAEAYGRLSMSVKTCIFVTDTATYEEIDEALTGVKNEADDIPKNTFSTDLKEID